MRRALVVVLALLATLLCGVAPAAVSHADVAPSDRDSFVTLWDARFHSGQAFQAYLDSDVQYDDGYNAYPVEDKQALVDALVAYWEANEPGFADGIDYDIPSGGLPARRGPVDDEDMPDHLLEGTRPSREMVVWIVYEMVFEKAEFKKRLLAENGVYSPDPKSLVPPADSNGVPTPARPPTPLDAVVDLVNATLLAAEDVYDAHRPVEVPGDIPQPDPVPMPFAPPRPAAPSYGTAAAGVRRRPAVPSRPRPLDLTDGKFWACAQPETAPSATCVQGTAAVNTLPNLPPLPLGPAVQPVPGVSVAFSVGVVASTANPSAIAGISAVTQIAADPAATHTHAWAYFQPLAGTPFLRFGFGGYGNDPTTYAALQPKQTLTATIGLPGLATAALDAHAEVTYNGATSPTVVTEVGYGPSTSGPDTVLATAVIDRAPPVTRLRACHTIAGMPTLQCPESGLAAATLAAGTIATVVRVEHDLPPSATPPDLTVRIVVAGTTERTTAKATLPGVPSWAQVRLDTNDTAQQTTATYTAAAVMTRASADVRIVTLGPDPRYRHATVTVQSMPTSVVVVLLPDHVTYTANAEVLASASGEPALAASFDNGIPGTPDTVYVSAAVTASNVPKSVDFSLLPGTGTQPPRVYGITLANPGGGAVAVGTLTAAYRDYAAQRDVQGVVHTVPLGTYTLQLPDPAHKELVWNGAGVGDLEVWGSVAPWQFHATVANVPGYWRFGLATQQVTADATTGGGSTITAWITNTGTVLSVPAAYTNGVVADVTLTGNPLTALVSAALRVVGLQHIDVAPGDPKNGVPTTFHLVAGAGGTFYLWAKLHDQTSQPVRHGWVEGVVTSFPGSITGTMGPTSAFDVVTSNHPTIDLHGEWGSSAALAQLPPVPHLHGLAVRDGGPATDIAYAANFYLTGLPSHVHVQKDDVLVTGFQPTIDRLQADIVLDSDPAHAVVAMLDLQNVPTGASSTFDVHWTVTKATSGAKTINAGLTASAPMGPLYVFGGGATFAAFAQVSVVPAVMNLSTHEAEGSQTVTWNASQQLDDVWIGLQTRASLGSPFGTHGALHLHEVPKSWSITVGHDPNGLGPRFDYVTADTVAPAQRLDVTAVADETLHTTGTFLAASLLFELVDLGTSTSLVTSGSALTLVGSTRTAKIKATVSAYVDTTTTKTPPPWQPTSWIAISHSLSLNVKSVAAFFTVEVDDVRTLSVTPGISTRIAGDFASFSVGWAALFVKFTGSASMTVDLHVIAWWHFTIASASLTTPFLPVSLHAYSTGETEVSTLGPFPFHIEVHVTVRPKEYAIAPWGSPLVLAGTPGTEVTYWVTPNVLWPAGRILTDVITAICGTGLKFGVVIHQH